MSIYFSIRCILDGVCRRVADYAAGHHQAFEDFEEANLLTMKQEGRERRYTLSPQPLAEAVFWVTAVTEQRQHFLQALCDYLAAEEANQ